MRQERRLGRTFTINDAAVQGIAAKDASRYVYEPVVGQVPSCTATFLAAYEMPLSPIRSHVNEASYACRRIVALPNVGV